MGKLRCIVLLLAAAGLWGGVAPARAPVPAGPALDKETRAEIRKLLVQRRAILKDEVHARTQEFENGVGFLFLLLDARKKLLEAELELATKQAERVAAHKSYHDALRKAAKQTKEGYEAGRVKAADHFQARAAQLAAEIGWLRAGGKATKPEK